MLLIALVERFDVSHMQDFYSQKNKCFFDLSEKKKTNGSSVLVIESHMIMIWW